MQLQNSKILENSRAPLKISHLINADEAAEIMKVAKRNAAVVTSSGGKLEGLLTSRDLKNKVIARNKKASDVTVSQIMDTDIEAISADENLFDALCDMKKEKRHHMPITDSSGGVVGMLTDTDLAVYTLDEAMGQTKRIAKATVTKNYQPFILTAVIAIYMLAILCSFLPPFGAY